MAPNKDIALSKRTRIKKRIIEVTVILLTLWIIYFVYFLWEGKIDVVRGSSTAFTMLTLITSSAVITSIILLLTNHSLLAKIKADYGDTRWAWDNFIDSGFTSYFSPKYQKYIGNGYKLTTDTSIMSDIYGLPIVDKYPALHLFNSKLYMKYHRPVLELMNAAAAENVRFYGSNPSTEKIDRLAEKIMMMYEICEETTRIKVLGETCMLIKSPNGVFLLLDSNEFTQFYIGLFKNPVWQDMKMEAERKIKVRAFRSSGLNWFVKACFDTHKYDNVGYSPEYATLYDEVCALVELLPNGNLIVFNSIMEFIRDNDNELGYGSIDFALTKLHVVKTFDAKVKNIHDAIVNFIKDMRPEDKELPRKQPDMVAFYNALLGHKNPNAVIDIGNVLEGLNSSNYYYRNLINVKDVITNVSLLNSSKASRVLIQRIRNNANKLTPKDKSITTIVKLLPYVKKAAKALNAGYAIDIVSKQNENAKYETRKRKQAAAKGMVVPVTDQAIEQLNVLSKNLDVFNKTLSQTINEADYANKITQMKHQLIIASNSIGKNLKDVSVAKLEQALNHTKEIRQKKSALVKFLKGMKSYKPRFGYKQKLTNDTQPIATVEPVLSTYSPANETRDDKIGYNIFNFSNTMPDIVRPINTQIEVSADAKSANKNLIENIETLAVLTTPFTNTDDQIVMESRKEDEMDEEDEEAEEAPILLSDIKPTESFEEVSRREILEKDMVKTITQLSTLYILIEQSKKAPKHDPLVDARYKAFYAEYEQIDRTMSDLFQMKDNKEVQKASLVAQRAKLEKLIEQIDAEASSLKDHISDIERKEQNALMIEELNSHKRSIEEEHEQEMARLKAFERTHREIVAENTELKNQINELSANAAALIAREAIERTRLEAQKVAFDRLVMSNEDGRYNAALNAELTNKNELIKSGVDEVLQIEISKHENNNMMIEKNLELDLNKEIEQRTENIVKEQEKNVSQIQQSIQLISSTVSAIASGDIQKSNGDIDSSQQLKETVIQQVESNRAEIRAKRKAENARIKQEDKEKREQIRSENLKWKTLNAQLPTMTKEDLKNELMQTEQMIEEAENEATITTGVKRANLQKRKGIIIELIEHHTLMEERDALMRKNMEFEEQIKLRDLKDAEQAANQIEIERVRRLKEEAAARDAAEEAIRLERLKANIEQEAIKLEELRVKAEREAALLAQKQQTLEEMAQQQIKYEEKKKIDEAAQRVADQQKKAAKEARHVAKLQLANEQKEADIARAIQKGIQLERLRVQKEQEEEERQIALQEEREAKRLQKLAEDDRKAKEAQVMAQREAERRKIQEEKDNEERIVAMEKAEAERRWKREAEEAEETRWRKEQYEQQSVEAIKDLEDIIITEEEYEPQTVRPIEKEITDTDAEWEKKYPLLTAQQARLAHYRELEKNQMQTSQWNAAEEERRRQDEKYQAMLRRRAAAHDARFAQEKQQALESKLQIEAKRKRNAEIAKKRGFK